jgi:alginate O-acetyltransferase complex protein AlgJ
MALLTTDVFEGLDDWLFLVGGGNNVQHLFSASPHERRSLLQAWIELLSKRAAYARSNFGAVYKHCFIPDKLSVYRDLSQSLAESLVFLAEELEASADEAGLSTVLVPLTAYFRRQAKKHQLFCKTDTHWTVEGCFSAYQMICACLGIEPKQEMIFRPSSLVERAWDLGSKTDPQRIEKVRIGRFGIGATKVYANDIVELRESGAIRNEVGLHVGSMVHYRNQKTESTERMLVFGDSFFEYRSHYLTGMFSETVEEICFVWSSAIDWDIAREFKPTIILTEIAERFMGTIPRDGIDIRKHAEEKVKKALAANLKA